MNLIQLIIFAWIGAWVLGESLFPLLSYGEKLQASITVAFSIAYLNDLHGIIWRKIKAFFSVKKA